jgi:hypothetical protein
MASPLPAHSRVAVAAGHGQQSSFFYVGGNKGITFTMVAKTTNRLTSCLCHQFS